MSASREREHARRTMVEAEQTYYAILELPNRNGSRVQWVRNEIIWVRANDDIWLCEGNENFGPYSSGHVSSVDWVQIWPNAIWNGASWAVAD